MLEYASTRKRPGPQTFELSPALQLSNEGDAVVIVQDYLARYGYRR